MKTVSLELFPQLGADTIRVLEHLPAVLDAVLPLKAAHRRDLPAAVQELSARLTCERGGYDRSYWGSPRLASAYLRYFLPWNLLRLVRLMDALVLPCPPIEAAERAVVLDIGSGPLTLPLALWLAKPQWRELPLDVVCLDNSPRALELGRAIFACLAGDKTTWRVIPVRADINALEREVRWRPWLIGAANVLNELKTKHASLRERLAAFAEQTTRLLHPQGALLCVEPGTRLGARVVQSLRDELLALGFAPVQPCPHAGPCPLQSMRSWCHFSLSTQGRPDWLAQLTREARLSKNDLHLSFALMQSQAAARSVSCGGRAEVLKARVLSGPFKVPGVDSLARYACSVRGLLLLTQAADTPVGALVEVQWSARHGRDRHSGAWIV